MLPCCHLDFSCHLVSRRAWLRLCERRQECCSERVDVYPVHETQ